MIASLVLAAFVSGCGGNGETDRPAELLDDSGSARAGVLPPTATPTPPSSENSQVGQPEPFMVENIELDDLDGWINSPPLSISGLVESGRVTLLDFWTYTCVNCVRTFPYLNAWHEAYSEHGLTVIGVHSPEFEFEKLPENVQRAINRYGIKYPVALDGEKRVWDRYGNHFWPSKYLIDSQGEVVFRHFGEGAYDEIETIIRAELETAGFDLSEVNHTLVPEPERSEGAHTVTRELYGGFANNFTSDGLYAGQDAYYEAPDAEIEYSDDGTRRHGQFFLDGRWVNTANAIVSANRSSGDDDAIDADIASAYFAFEFFATSVNAVLGDTKRATGDRQAGVDVVVEIDGRSLLPEEAGEDVVWDTAGNSVLRVGETRLYQIVELPRFGKRELTLKTNSEGMAVYTITFGVYEFGP